MPELKLRAISLKREIEAFTKAIDAIAKLDPATAENLDWPRVLAKYNEYRSAYRIFKKNMAGLKVTCYRLSKTCHEVIPEIRKLGNRAEEARDENNPPPPLSKALTDLESLAEETCKDQVQMHQRVWIPLETFTKGNKE